MSYRSHTELAGNHQRDVIHLISPQRAGAMPKYGYAPNPQAKRWAAAIVRERHDTTVPQSSYVNTGYSLVRPQYGISFVAVYQYNDLGRRIL